MQQSTNFSSFDGKKLFLHSFESAQPKAILCFIHGMAEHGGRYAHFGKAMNEKGVSLFTYDQRGHGRTLDKDDTIGFIAPHDGWKVLLQDALAFVDFIREGHPDTPLFLMGHSMGALIVANAVELNQPHIAGVVLSALPENQGGLATLGILISSVHAAVLGDKSPGKLQTNMTFGEFNKAFKPNRTDFDWISRDEKAVDKYIADPMCGGVFTASFFKELAKGAKSVHNPSSIKMIPHNLPVILFAGSEDPVAGKRKGFEKTLVAFKGHLDKLESKIYENGRHEMINEINKDELFEDLSSWLLQNV